MSGEERKNPKARISQLLSPAPPAVITATQTPKAQRGQKVPTGDGANSDRKDLWAPKAHLDVSNPGAKSALPARLELTPKASKALSDQKRRVCSARPDQLGQKAREALKAMLGKEGRLAVKGRKPQQARKVRRGRPAIKGREAILLEARRAQSARRAHRAYRDQQVLRAIKVRQVRRGRRAT